MIMDLDITKCKGCGCKLKKKCWRYTAPANPARQSYFQAPSVATGGTCEYFWQIDEPKKSKKKSK